MGNPIKDTIRDFAVNKEKLFHSPIDDTVNDFGVAHNKVVLEHMRKAHKEEMYNMLMKDVEDEDTNISEEGIKNLKFDSQPQIVMQDYDHARNINRMKKAVKNDDNKTRMDLLPSKALEGIAKIFTFGAKKYNDYNYKNGKGLDWNRPFAACLRHLNAWNDGEDLDKESGKSHLYHAGCCIMMLIDLVDSNIGDDKRYESIDGPPQD